MTGRHLRNTLPGPYFSVVIPTYNRAGLLAESLGSILGQTCQDYEVVIVDDGSTDGTGDVIRERFGKYPQLRYQWQRNAERGAARNNGLAEAQGEFVVFLDSDDLMLPDHLDTLKRVTQMRPEVNVLATKFNFVRDGEEYGSPLSKLSEGFYDRELLIKGNPFGCLVCVRRERLSPRPFPEDRKYSIGEDWMFLFQALAQDRIYLIDKTTVLLRDHPGRSMNCDNSTVIEHKLNAVQWIQENASLSPAQHRRLEGHAFLFCAVHAYLDSDLWKGLDYWFRALAKLGPSMQVLAMFPKVCLGKRWVRRLASCLAVFSKAIPLRT